MDNIDNINNTSIFPKIFDIEFYKINNTDLSSFNDIELINHYKTYGEDEGRLCSVGQLKNFIKLLPTQFNKCLEIGPFDVPKITGDNVDYFDVLNSEELRKRAIAINRISNLQNIPFIKYVEKNGDLNIIDGKFDLIFSAHLIEHNVDLVKHLIDIQKILNDGGYYILIIPDKRYCFDHFFKESTIIDIVNVYYDKNIDKNLHSLKSIIEHQCMITHNDSTQHWCGNHGIPKLDIKSVLASVSEYNNSIKNNLYLDVHAWQFTPKSFIDIINLLGELNLITFKITEVYNTIKNDIEFVAILQNKIK